MQEIPQIISEQHKEINTATTMATKMNTIKEEELESSATFDSDEQEELAKLQMITENIKINLAKVKEVKKYWGDKIQVHTCVRSYVHIDN